MEFELNILLSLIKNGDVAAIKRVRRNHPVENYHVALALAHFAAARSASIEVDNAFAEPIGEEQYSSPILESDARIVSSEPPISPIKEGLRELRIIAGGIGHVAASFGNSVLALALRESFREFEELDVPVHYHNYHQKRESKITYLTLK